MSPCALGCGAAPPPPPAWRAELQPAGLPPDFEPAGGWWNRFPLCAPPGRCVNPGRRILEVNELFKREKKKGEEEEEVGQQPPERFL